MGMSPRITEDLPVNPTRYADHTDFLKAILENADEATSALVYADWLEENGHPAAATVIRRHVEGMTSDGDMTEAAAFASPFHGVNWDYYKVPQPSLGQFILDTSVYNDGLHRIRLGTRTGVKNHLGDERQLDWIYDEYNEAEAQRLLRDLFRAGAVADPGSFHQVTDFPDEPSLPPEIDTSNLDAFDAQFAPPDEEPEQMSRYGGMYYAEDDVPGTVDPLQHWLEILAQAPHDVTSRAVFADWLEENAPHLIDPNDLFPDGTSTLLEMLRSPEGSGMVIRPHPTSPYLMIHEPGEVAAFGREAQDGRYGTAEVDGKWYFYPNDNDWLSTNHNSDFSEGFSTEEEALRAAEEWRDDPEQLSRYADDSYYVEPTGYAGKTFDKLFRNAGEEVPTDYADGSRMSSSVDVNLPSPPENPGVYDPESRGFGRTGYFVDSYPEPFGWGDFDTALDQDRWTGRHARNEEMFVNGRWEPHSDLWQAVLAAGNMNHPDARTMKDSARPSLEQYPSSRPWTLHDLVGREGQLPPEVLADWLEENAHLGFQTDKERLESSTPEQHAAKLRKWFGGDRHILRALSGDPPTPASRYSQESAPVNYADEADLQHLLHSLTPAEWRGRRASPTADMNRRLALADMLRDLGRDRDADLLGNPDIHLFRNRWSGVITDARELSRELHKEGFSRKHSYPALEAYLDAALWGTTDDDGTPLNEIYDWHAIHPSTLAAMVADMHQADVDSYDIHPNHMRDLFGHDLFMSRNGHGVGFFSRPEEYGDAADALQEWAKGFGEYHLYVGDDGLIHGSYAVDPEDEPAPPPVEESIELADDPPEDPVFDPYGDDQYPPEGYGRYDRAGNPVAYSHDDFLKLIRRKPKEATHRAVFADWLAEHDPDSVTPVTLEFLRSHMGPAWAHRTPEGKVKAGKVWTLPEIKAANKAAGRHFFDRSTNRFFGSKFFPSRVYSGPGGVYFVHEGDNFNRTARQSRIGLFHPKTGNTGAWGTYFTDPDGGEFHRHDVFADPNEASELAKLLAWNQSPFQKNQWWNDDEHGADVDPWIPPPPLGAPLPSPDEIDHNRTDLSRYEGDFAPTPYADMRTIRALMKHIRENPYDSDEQHMALADALEDLEPGNPVSVALRRQYGFGEFGEHGPRENAWNETVSNSWDGTFPHTFPAGKSKFFNFHLGGEGRPGQNPTWTVHAVSSLPGLNDTGYTFEYPISEAHQLASHFPNARAWVMGDEGVDEEERQRELFDFYDEMQRIGEMPEAEEARIKSPDFQGYSLDSTSYANGSRMGKEPKWNSEGLFEQSLDANPPLTGVEARRGGVGGGVPMASWRDAPARDAFDTARRAPHRSLGDALIAVSDMPGVDDWYMEGQFSDAPKPEAVSVWEAARPQDSPPPIPAFRTGGDPIQINPIPTARHLVSREGQMHPLILADWLEEHARDTSDLERADELRRWFAGYAADGSPTQYANGERMSPNLGGVGENGTYGQRGMLNHVWVTPEHEQVHRLGNAFRARDILTAGTVGGFGKSGMVHRIRSTPGLPEHPHDLSGVGINEFGRHAFNPWEMARFDAEQLGFRDDPMIAATSSDLPMEERMPAGAFADWLQEIGLDPRADEIRRHFDHSGLPEELEPTGYAEGGEFRTPAGFPEHETFTRLIHGNPKDATQHFVHADWLDDNDFPDEAAFRRAMGGWFQSGKSNREWKWRGLLPGRMWTLPWEDPDAIPEGIPPTVITPGRLSEEFDGTFVPPYMESVAIPWVSHPWHWSRPEDRYRGEGVFPPFPDKTGPSYVQWGDYPNMEEGLRRAFMQSRKKDRDTPTGYADGSRMSANLDGVTGGYGQNFPEFPEPEIPAGWGGLDDLPTGGFGDIGRGFRPPTDWATLDAFADARWAPSRALRDAVDAVGEFPGVADWHERGQFEGQPRPEASQVHEAAYPPMNPPGVVVPDRGRGTTRIHPVPTSRHLVSREGQMHPLILADWLEENARGEDDLKRVAELRRWFSGT